MKNQTWKAIKGYEGTYEVSDLGNVRSLDRTIIKSNGTKVFLNGQLLTLQYDSKNGRPMVRLYDSKTKKGKTIKTHVLVALTFLSNGERPEGMDICHNNGDVTDNRVENLRFDSRSNNQIDILKHTNKCAAGKLSIEQVVEIRRAYKEKEINQHQLAKKFKVSQGNISEIVNRKLFDYINDDGSIDYKVS